MESLLRKSIEKVSLVEKNNSNLGEHNNATYESKLIINDKRYVSIPLISENFYSIERKSSRKRFAFIDGGNQNIYSDANISIDAIRVYYCIWKEEKKVEAKKFDFICVTKVVFDGNNELKYKSELITESGIVLPSDVLNFDPKEETLRSGVFDLRVFEVASKIRRYLELFVAKKVINERLELYETIVLDGTLQETTVNEELFLNELCMVAHKKGVLVCSVCKSTNVYTNTNESYGDSLTYLSKKVSEKLNRFVYYPAFFVDENLGLSEVFFAKFHERSKLVLKVEILCGDARNVDIIKFFSQLSFYCKDPILLGYPYGLIDADKFARISNEEASYLKTIFAVKGTKNEMILETFDLHSVLDRISY